MQIDLQCNEQKIDTWSVAYRSPGGRKFNGKLTVTNKRLLYDVPFNLNAKGFLPEIMFIKWGLRGYLEIAKSDITAFERKGHVFERRIDIVLIDGSRHSFMTGLLGGYRLAEAIFRQGFDRRPSRIQ